MSETHKINTKLNLILETKKNLIKELNLVTLKDTSYSNVKFDLDSTQYDKVNKPLLDDLQAAAKSAGIIATITTAKSGHGGTNSRHAKQTAVDIAILNGVGSGGATGPSNGNYKFKLMGDKLKDALVSMGYSWNRESGNPKSVLWQTNTGGNHFNHLHISNETNTSSSSSSPSLQSGDSESSEPSQKSSSGQGDDIISSMGRKFGSQFGNAMLGSFVGESINEQISDKSLGKNVSDSNGVKIIPHSDNEKVYSPVYGAIKIDRANSSCNNEVKILFVDNGKKYSLQYCNLNNVYVKNGESVSPGDKIGSLITDVEVSLLDRGGSKSSFSGRSSRNNMYGGSYGEKNSDPLVKGIGKAVSKIFTPFKNKYDDSGKMIEKRWGSPTEKEQPEPWFQKLSPTYRDLDENIKRIKRLL